MTNYTLDRKAIRKSQEGRKWNVLWRYSGWQNPNKCSERTCWEKSLRFYAFQISNIYNSLRIEVYNNVNEKENKLFYYSQSHVLKIKFGCVLRPIHYFSKYLVAEADECIICRTIIPNSLNIVRISSVVIRVERMTYRGLEIERRVPARLNYVSLKPSCMHKKSI